jgi:hypothetical protein
MLPDSHLTRNKLLFPAVQLPVRAFYQDSIDQNTTLVRLDSAAPFYTTNHHSLLIWPQKFIGISWPTMTWFINSALILFPLNITNLLAVIR